MDFVFSIQRDLAADVCGGRGGGVGGMGMEGEIGTSLFVFSFLSMLKV